MAEGSFEIPESFVEKLHPLSKMLFLLMVIVTTIWMDELILVGIVGLMVVLYMALARLLLRLLPFILFYLLSSSVLIGLLFLLSGRSIQVELATLIFAKFFAHIFSGLVLAFTTAPRKMAATLKQLRLPQKLLFIFILALRLFPVIIKEYRYILDSLRLRNQPVIDVLLFRPQLVVFPILVRSVKLSDELALSAETRGFSMDKIRIPLQAMRFGKRDLLFTGMALVIMVLLILQESGHGLH
jgi:energy-coupling factor transport system permease protein